MGAVEGEESLPGTCEAPRAEELRPDRESKHGWAGRPDWTAQGFAGHG